MAGLVNESQTLAKYASSQSIDKPIQSFEEASRNPGNVSTRGVFIPYLIGRRRIGPILAWEGDRFQLSGGGTYTSGKGTGVRTGHTVTQLAAGWHILCVGPASKLHKIYESGAVVWEGPIDRTSHPSGTEIDAGATVGRFTIFWGEEDQPVNIYLGALNAQGDARVGITSRWPGVCYLVWAAKVINMGNFWPLMHYELERQPELIDSGDADPLLTGSVGWFPQATVAGTTFPIVGALDGGPGVGYFSVSGNQTADFQPGALVIVASQPGLGVDGNYVVLYSTYGGSWINTGLLSKAWTAWISSPPGGTPVTANTPPAPQGLPGDVYRLATNGSDRTYYQLAGNYVAQDEAQRFSVYVSAQTIFTPIVDFGIGIENHAVGLGLEFDLQFQSSGTVLVLNDTLPPEALISITNVGNNWFLVSLEITSTVVTGLQLRRCQVTLKNNSSVLNVFFPTLDEIEGTRVFFREALTLTTPNVGTLTIFTIDDFDGANAAHMINELLFQEWPHGIGADRDDFDVASLETLGAALAVGSEKQISHMLAVGGKGLEQVLSDVLADVGCMFRWDVNLGQWGFPLIRAPGTHTTKIYQLSDDVVVEDLAIIIFHDPETQVERVAFSFVDRERNYQDSTLIYSHDGLTALVGSPKLSPASLPTVTDFPSAAKVSDRRTQEDLPKPVQVEVVASRASRRIRPGDSLSVASYAPDLLLRVVSIQLDTESDKVKLICLADSYGVPASSFNHTGGGGLPIVGAVALPDLQFRYFEWPKYIATPNIMEIGIPRIRASQNIIVAGLHISRAGGTYTLIGSDFEVQTGGVLNEEMPIAAIDGPLGFHNLETGPEVNILGQDFGDVENLSGALTEWRLGRQWALIGEEICYVREMVPVSGNTFRLDGLIRARLGTRRALHAVNTEVYLFQFQELRRDNDILLVPGNALFCKTSPQTQSSSVSLDDVVAFDDTLTGEAIRPPVPGNLRIIDPYNSYERGAANDLPLVWSYQSTGIPGTGIGMQNAGSATGISPVEGNFTLDFYTDVAGSPGVLKDTVTGIVVPSYTYTNADMQTAFGSEPLLLWVILTNVGGGLSSDTIQTQIEGLKP